MTETKEDATEAGTPPDVNAAETEEVNSGGLRRLNVGGGVVVATASDFDWMMPVTSRVESIADELESGTEVLIEDSEDAIGDADDAEDSSVLDVVELARLAVVSGYVGASGRVEPGTELRDNDTALEWLGCVEALEVLVTLLVEVTVEVELPTCTVDAEAAAADDVGLALGRTFTLSALMISAA